MIASAIVAIFNVLYTVWLYYEVFQMAESLHPGSIGTVARSLDAGGRFAYNFAFFVPLFINAAFLTALVAFVAWSVARGRRKRLPRPPLHRKT
jgi:hypothetical protein